MVGASVTEQSRRFDTGREKALDIRGMSTFEQIGRGCAWHTLQ